MGWKDWLGGERSDGETGKVENVDVNVKVNDQGKVSDVIVSREGEREKHDHYYNTDKDKSGVKERVDWKKK